VKSGVLLGIPCDFHENIVIHAWCRCANATCVAALLCISAALRRDGYLVEPERFPATLVLVTTPLDPPLVRGGG